MEIEMRGLAETARWELGLPLSVKQQEAFAWYARELIEWNRRFNLTAIEAPEDIEIKHFLDCLSCLRVLGPGPSGRLADVGSGAGFPGIPLKIAAPDLAVTLIESNSKKAEFCRHIVEGLGLEGVEVLNARAEEVGRSLHHREVYDWAVARAVARLPILVELLLPFLKVGGLGIAQKGESGPAEAEQAEPALEATGGRIREMIPVNLPRVAEPRFLMVIEKMSATPDRFPRRPGMAAKRPLGLPES
ncbi:MAG: 16S rRNA (guanine(527)-N(7))-methyltransferase RsmG [Anaerolineales bacterium]